MPHRRYLYALLNPSAQGYESIKRLSDSELLTLALFQQLRGIESERSFLRDVQRFFSHLFPGASRDAPLLAPSTRSQRLRSYLQPLRRALVEDLIGDPETLVVDSTQLPGPPPGWEEIGRRWES